jgi:RecA/RadA recombinase
MMIKALALVSTVLLLMTLGFSVLGTTPLLVLKHVQPMDSRIIRQVFHYCYRLIAVVAIAACIGNALVDRQDVSFCAGAIAILELALHHWILIRMDALRVTMHDGDAQAVSNFRQLHAIGVFMNIALFSVAIWAITQIKP